MALAPPPPSAIASAIFLIVNSWSANGLSLNQCANSGSQTMQAQLCTKRDWIRPGTVHQISSPNQAQQHRRVLLNWTGRIVRPVQFEHSARTLHYSNFPAIVAPTFSADTTASGQNSQTIRKLFGNLILRTLRIESLSRHRP